MVLTEELKEALVAEINADADFGFRLFKTIMDRTGDRSVTTTYLDRALARQSREFDEKLARLAETFDEKLARQSKEFDEKLARLAETFDEKLARQSRDFDDKLARQTEALKRFIDRKLGRIGSRWGEKVEANYRLFAQTIVAQWGGTVSKWRRKLNVTDERGHQFLLRYEVDIMITNGKLLLVEMKSQCDWDDVERFLEHAKQYVSLETPVQPVGKVILTFDITTPAQELADAASLIVIMLE